MTIYIILVLLSVFFTWLQHVGSLKNGMRISFFLIFLFLALRYNYGNDYSSYYEEFISLQSLQDEDFYFKANEVGWLYLNYFFKYLFGNTGFFIMMASMAALTCFVLYRFTTKYIPTKYYTFTIALLLLEPNNILVLSSAMRQSVAVAIFLLSFDYLIKRKFLKYLAGILIASLFHTSVLIFMTLILLNIVNWKIYLPYILFVFIVLVVLLNNLKVIFDQIDFLLESQGSDYLFYTQQGFNENKYGLGFAFSAFLYLSVLIVNRKIHKNLERIVFVKIAIVALLLLILGLSLQLANRLSYYIFPLVVSAYVITLVDLGKAKFVAAPVITRLMSLIIVSFFIYQNYIFWQSEVYSPFFKEYKTVFMR
jgi:hypothetical protein